jgi:ABC-2 type transport system permease protein
MMASARAELLRLRKWPVTWIITGVWLTLNVSFGYVFDYLSYRDAVSSGNDRVADTLLAHLSPAEAPITMLTGLPMFGSALMLILAALATGSGYGWETWKTVFTQGPRRSSALGGTLIALAVVMAVVTVLTLITDVVAGSIVTAIAGQDLTWPGPAVLAKGLGGGLLITAMWATAGAMIGIVARSPALAVGLGLVWAMVVENLLRGVAGVLGPLESVTNVMPGTAAGSLSGALGAPTAGTEGGAPGVLTVLTGPQATSLLSVYLIVFATLAVFVVSRRDA